MLNFSRTSLIALLFVQWVTTNAIAQTKDSAEVARIGQTASAAQGAGDFEIAAEQWEQIITQFPDATEIGIAFYNSGFCHVQTGNFAMAADRLRQSIEKLDANSKQTIASAFLFLGFSQGKLGRELAVENPAESKQWLTDATQTFKTLLSRFPNFKDVDQALFFQGDAFEALERWGAAADSYSKMLELDDPEFKLDGLFALAFIRGQQGKYAEAFELYSQFEKEGQQHSALNEVRFRAAESLIELARAAENRGETDRRSGLLSEAIKKFEAVYQSRDAQWADDAKFEQATALQRLGKLAESAVAFESVVQIPNSELADRARVYAGRDYMRSGQYGGAKQLLEKALAIPGEYSAEAAHWLSQLYLRSEQHEQAYALAKEWAAKTDDLAIKVPLLLDQADAAYASQTRRAESRDLYLAITSQFPRHRLAATSLYNAAFAAMETGDFKDAISLTTKFRTSYDQSDYLPDVLEVEADSYLLAKQPEQASASLTALIAKFEGHPKQAQWELRKGLALHLQKDHRAAIDLLEGVTPRLDDTAKKAEALHWIGASHYQMGDSSKSIEYLKSSLATDRGWRRADETMLTLSRAYYQAERPDQAKQTTEKLIQEFPTSPLIGEANYRLAEFEYDAGNYESAIQSYVEVVDKFTDSQFAPHAMYGIGWSHLQLNQFAESIETFSKLIEVFPTSALATEVLVGRASAYRQSGDPEKAIADAKQYLAADAAQTKKEEALYELGLAQIDAKKWDGVISTFNQLLALSPSSNLADRFHYELAWAHKANKDSKSALENFGTIAEKWPASSLAPESNFHLGQDAYENKKDYTAAARHFQLCIDRCKNKGIKEKAIYKLAWSQYKQKDFNKALDSFRRQIQEFPEGKLHADALFMVSESLYENNQHREALQQYRVAKPVIETSKTVSNNYKILTYLHGAQSANLAGEHQTAIEFANALLALDVNENIKQDARMEIGDAHRALRDFDNAVAAYSEAARHPGKTGARSMCMVGEIYFDQKNFADAINKFKLVWYGYGGSEATDAVKPWQALALFEAARCNLVMASVSESNQAVKEKHVQEAVKFFENLLKKFPNDKMATEAKNQLEKLKS